MWPAANAEHQVMRESIRSVPFVPHAVEMEQSALRVLRAVAPAVCLALSVTGIRVCVSLVPLAAARVMSMSKTDSDLAVNDVIEP